MVVRVKLCVPISALAPAVTAAADVASVVIAVSATAVTALAAVAQSDHFFCYAGARLPG